MKLFCKMPAHPVPAHPVPAHGRARFLTPLLLALAVIAAYAISLPGGFLNYDDPWLVRDNPLLARTDLGVLRAIWLDLGTETRHVLGSEYLPVRDTVVWLELRLFGAVPQLLRTANLGLYLGAVLIFRAYLVRALPEHVGELAAWLFALHPVHAESVAWLAGQKDVLALFFCAAALYSYRTGRHVVLVPIFVALAVLSKAMAIVTPVLLLCDDLLSGRRPRWRIALASLGVAGGLLGLHVAVGKAVGMLTGWIGGSRATTIATMGVVWLRYLANAFVPLRLSVQQEHTVHAATELWPWVGYLALVAAGTLAFVAFRRGARLWLWAWAWFVVGLGPTSQILAPLQNRMADRYLLFSVLGACVVLAQLCRRLGYQLLSAGVVIIFAALSVVRAHVFADSVRLWEDAVASTSHDPRPAYQLGMAWRERGSPAAAEAAFRLAVTRAKPSDDTGRAAGNHLATLLASRGQLAEAQALLRELATRFPDDPKVLNNLAEVTARRGDDAGARRLFEEVLRRFPGYAPGRRNYDKHFGQQEQ